MEDIWINDDQTKITWVREKIISGLSPRKCLDQADSSLLELEERELKFVKHKKYGVIPGMPEQAKDRQFSVNFQIQLKRENSEKLKNLAK